MVIKQGTLFFAIFFALIFHAGGIFWLHHFPLSFEKREYENYVSIREDVLDSVQRERRTQILAEACGHVIEKEPQVKCSLHELKVEFTPQFELSFPQEIPCSLAESDFSFKNVLSSEELQGEFESFEREKRNGVSLIAPFSDKYIIGAPPLADVRITNDDFEEFTTLAGSEHFDIHIEYAPKRSRPGYVFKITLLPRSEVQFKKIRQNYYFLLDRSNSIPRARYFLNKKAVAEALAFLKPEDRFNILIFDDHVVRLNDNPVESSKTKIEEALAFLDKQGHGGYFAATELYTSLGKIIPHDVAENEVNSAILLSDGDTYLSQEKQRLTIGKWTGQNKGKVSLYAVASGTGNNLPLLELLSAFNKGSLIYAQDHLDISERLGFLMRTIQNPIGKQMVVTAVCEDKSMTVFLQPKQPRIPDLYQNRPFVIYGTTNKLSDFLLFVQGRYYDQRFDIKKRISFDQGKIGSYSVERGWTQLVVQEFYEQYFADGNLSHLEAAKQLLSPLNLPTPFID